MDDWEIADGDTDPRGYDLMGRDGEKIGTIDNLLCSPTTQQAHFAIVDTGGWFSHKKFLVPMEYLHFGGGRASGPFTKELFQKAPEWHDGDRDYGRYFSYWMNPAAPVAASTGTEQRTAAVGATDGAAATGPAGAVVIPVVDEDLQVGKRQVEHTVRILTRVTEKPVEETIQLREERVNVERRPANRAPTAADKASFKEGTYEVTATAEEAVISKQAHVVEEVVVGKQATERTETVRDTVRRTNVDVDEDVDENEDRGAAAPRTAQRV
jgi:uncharacterized protein (TIGR02271 family)